MEQVNIEKAGLVTDETLTSLRYEYDVVASEALEKLYEITRDELQASCPVPTSDLYEILRKHHEEDPALQRLWEEVNNVPPWVDWAQIQRGQEFFYRYTLANVLGFALQGFIGENVAAFGPAEVLVRTGGLSGKNLMKRVFETFQWVVETTECLSSIQPGGKGHASTIRVRLLHASVRRRIRALAQKRPSYFNLDTFGHPINEYDSILTVTFFCCNPIWVQLPQFGIHPSDGEIEDFIALYRYLSYLLGTPNEYFDSANQAKATMTAMLAHKKPPSQSSRKIAHAFIDCLTDSPPVFLSRDLINAGCRKMNKDELCEDLAIDKPSIFAAAVFNAICWIVYALAQMQKASSRIDALVVSVRDLFRKQLLYSKSLITDIIF